MATRLWLPLFFGFIVPPAVSQLPPPGEQQDVERRILDACRDDRTALLDSLVRSNRLLVKPLVEGMLAKAIRSDPSGRSDAFREEYGSARTLSTAFQRVHGEKSLALAVECVWGWSRDQRIVKLLADSLHALGTKLRGKAETRDSSLAAYLKALELYRSIGDRRGEGTALGSLGFVYWFRDDSLQALRYFQEGLSARSGVDDRQLVGNSLNDIGSAYYKFFRNYTAAIDYLRRAEAVRREIGDRGGRGRTLDNIALAYWDSGDLESAERSCEAAAEAHASTGDEVRAARSLHNGAILLTDLGRYADALRASDRSLEIRQRQGDTAACAQVLDAQGVVYYRMGDYESAYDRYRRALTMMEAAADERGIAAASYKIGVVLSDLGRSGQAFSAYQKSLDIARKTGDTQTALHALSNMGVAYFDAKQYRNAEAALRGALAMCRELPDYTVEIIDQTMLGNALNFQGKRDSAAAEYSEALSKARARESPELMWPALLGLGDLEEKHRAFESAIGYYTQALDCIERIRGSLAGEQFKVAFADRKRFVYEAVIHLLTTLHGLHPSAGYDSLAFRMAESAKARAFLDLIAESIAGVRAGADSALRAKADSVQLTLGGARRQLEGLLQDSRDSLEAVAARRRVDGLERELRRLENDLVVKNPRYATLRYPEPVGIDEVRKNVLDAHTIMLEYSLGDSSSSLWVVTQGESALFPLPPRQILKGQVEALCSALTDRGTAAAGVFRSIARRLYVTLLGPAERYLTEGTRLLIIPDGELHSVPFEVLLTKEGGQAFAGLPYLLKHHPITYVQSATVMSTLRSQRVSAAHAAQKDLIAFGDPIFGKEFPALPSSGTEVRAIAGMFPPGKADVYVRGEASEGNAKTRELLASYRFVHFATHGIVNEQRPDLSAILLSASTESGEDGYLRSSEIFNLHIPADLVVLSACRTGTGKLSRGEGLIGLTRAFMYAGAPSVVVSLWSVADLSTSVLMQKFYECLIAGGLDKAEALRGAKLSLCQGGTYAHPFYWAPFIIVGDWKCAP